MPIIHPTQLGQPKADLATTARTHVTIFTEARHRNTLAQQRQAVSEQVDQLVAAGRFRLTAVLNEAEPYRTFALERLTNWNLGRRVEGSNPYQLLTVTLRHRGTSPIKVVTERYRINPDQAGAEPMYRRAYGDWNPGQEITLPFEQAIGMLFKHGWYVDPHIPGRRRARRQLVEIVDGHEVGINGDPVKEPHAPSDQSSNKPAVKSAAKVS